MTGCEATSRPLTNTASDYLAAAGSDHGCKADQDTQAWKGFLPRLPPFQYFNLYEDEIEGKIDKDFYFVMPAMAAAMEGETFKAALVLCVNSYGVPFFWPVRALDEDRANAWTESAHNALKLATTKWVKIRANQKPGRGIL